MCVCVWGFCLPITGLLLVSVMEVWGICLGYVYFRLLSCFYPCEISVVTVMTVSYSVTNSLGYLCVCILGSCYPVTVNCCCLLFIWPKKRGLRMSSILNLGAVI